MKLANVLRPMLGLQETPGAWVPGCSPTCDLMPHMSITDDKVGLLLSMQSPLSVAAPSLLTHTSSESLYLNFY